MRLTTDKLGLRQESYRRDPKNFMNFRVRGIICHLKNIAEEPLSILTSSGSGFE